MARKNKPPLYAVNDCPNRADELVNTAAQDEATRFVEGYGRLKDKCESPIEELMMAALYASQSMHDISLDFYSTDTIPDTPYYDQAAHVYQQIQVGPYRVDILIYDATLPFEIAQPRLMIVECDGHDFHERTKEQARRDKQRDRFFQSRGFKVLRFTGSEIWADPEACADEVVDQLASNDKWRNSRG